MPTNSYSVGDIRTVFAATENRIAAWSRLCAALNSWLFGRASGPHRFLDLHRILMLRRETVIDEDHGDVRAMRDLADEPLVGVEAAEDPAAAVEVHHCRQAIHRPARTDDMDFGSTQSARLESFAPRY
jgi:hypothetical protein